MPRGGLGYRELGMVEAASTRPAAVRRVRTRIVVVGAGRGRAGDRGVGGLVARALRDLAPAEVQIFVPGGAGSSDEAALDGVTHILAIDCVEIGGAPGTVVLFEGETLRPCALSASMLDEEVANLIVLVGQHADAPEEVALLGVQRGEGEDDPSPEVAAAVPAMIDEAMDVLRGWLAGEGGRSSSPHRAEPPPC